MAASDNPAEQAQETVRVINALGLEPDKPPKPLALVNEGSASCAEMREMLEESTPCKSV
ncbi:MAG: hypothetical protein OXL98_14705 [Acidimicrobiaceae bacterium]|nr:hypothetical protein [Acidimicrobiaceae bacterium]